jgi:uncharacterized membrane protein YdbT with pleckstrin-like domain
MKPAAPSPTESERTLFEGHPAVLPTLTAWLLTIVTLGLAALWYKYQQLNVRYRVTTQRVVVERGVLGKRLEQVDLYRVVDYVAERPLSQRLVGTGNLLIRSVDRSEQLLELRGLPTDVLELYEQLRAATEEAKRRHAVRLVDYE